MTSKLLYVLTDGGRARLVERSPSSGDFVTIEEIDNQAALRQLRRELRASPPVRTQNSQGEMRHGVGKEDFLRPAKEAFVAQVADRALARARAGDFEAVVLAAPSRLASPLRERLTGHVRIAAVLRKDLTKTRDHELGEWLNQASFLPMEA